MSTSTTAACAPPGQEKFGGSYVAVASRPGSIPSGRLCAANAAHAAPLIVIDLSGEPFTVNVPDA